MMVSQTLAMLLGIFSIALASSPGAETCSGETCTASEAVDGQDVSVGSSLLQAAVRPRKAEGTKADGVSLSVSTTCPVQLDRYGDLVNLPNIDMTNSNAVYAAEGGGMAHYEAIFLDYANWIEAIRACKYSLTTMGLWSTADGVSSPNSAGQPCEINWSDRGIGVSDGQTVQTTLMRSQNPGHTACWALLNEAHPAKDYFACDYRYPEAVQKAHCSLLAPTTASARAGRAQ